MKVTTRIKIQTFLSDKKNFFFRERDHGGGTLGERKIETIFSRLHVKPNTEFDLITLSATDVP